MQTKPTAFFMFPKVAKNACGFAHKQTPVLTVLCGFCRGLWQEETWQVFLTSLLNTRQTREGVPRKSRGVDFCQGSFLFVVKLGGRKNTSYMSRPSLKGTGVPEKCLFYTWSQTAQVLTWVLLPASPVSFAELLSLPGGISVCPSIK